jgi:DNA repair protein RadD
VELRDYQHRAVAELRQAYCDGHEGAILELGTGAGKTVTAASVVIGAVDRGGWVLWVAHRRELLAQARRTLEAVGLGGALQASRVVLCTVQGRMPDRAEQPAVIVVDEGHRAMAASYHRIFTRWPDAFRVLLTGTAWRSDGASFDAVATKLIRGPSVAELTADGWLVPVRYWSVPGADLAGLRVVRGDFRPTDLAAAFDRPGLVGDVAATYQRVAAGRVGVVFASGVQHAEHLAEQLAAAGVSAAAVHAGTHKAERARLLEQHGAGQVQVLCSADLLIEGWDNPRVSAVVMARATASAIVWRQAVGRGLRTFAGKEDCVVLDHGANVDRLGLVAEPLEYEARPSGGARGPSTGGLALLTCQACFAVLPAQPRPASCPRCFAVLPRPAPRQVQSRPGELAEVTAPAAAKRRQIDWARWRRIDDERQQRGFKPGWTWARYNTQDEVEQWRAAQ